MYSNDENPTEVQMSGKGEVFEADEELLRINKLLTDFGSSPIPTNTMHLHHTAIYWEKYFSHKNKRVTRQNSYRSGLPRLWFN